MTPWSWRKFASGVVGGMMTGLLFGMIAAGAFLAVAAVWRILT